MRTASLIAAGALLCLWTGTAQADAWTATAPALPDPRSVRASLAGGVSVQDGLHAGMTPLARLEVGLGLTPHFALSAPLAVELALFRPSRGSALLLHAGLTDLWFSPQGQPFAPWVAALVGRVQLGVESSVRLGLGAQGVALGTRDLQRSVWLEGGGCWLVDLGPYATVGLGVAYERLVSGPGMTREPLLAGLGWVGDAHIEFLSVSAASGAEQPLLAVHLPSALDILVVVTVDVDSRTRDASGRYLLGLSGSWPNAPTTRERSRR